MLRSAFIAALAVVSTFASSPILAAPKAVKEMERVADWQLSHIAETAAIRASAGDPRDWQQATFWIGLTALADRSGDPHYRDTIARLGSSLKWDQGPRLLHADDQAIGAVWVWAARHGLANATVDPIRRSLDRVLADRPRGSLLFVPADKGDAPCTERWCWCDALFMAPPMLFALSRQTGDPRYAAFADREYRTTRDYLYDPAEHLFYRDSRYFDRRDDKGRKIFWSRGNGWVLSGLARLIPELGRKDPRRAYYVALFREMAARIVELQAPSGYWPPSLLAPENAPPETSGTGFYVHALAWGIKAGILPRDRYLPAVERGWSALRKAVDADGKLGWVQRVGAEPDAVAASDTQFYGVGAFLLAGSAVADLEGR